MSAPTGPLQPADDDAATRDPGLSPRDPSPDELGRRIRSLRIARGLTLKDLEQRGGISATHVSEIERGRASPTVGALGRIAQALEIRPATLVEPHVLPEITVMRAPERTARRLGMGRAQVEPVTGQVQGATLGAQIVSLPPGREPAAGQRHEGERLVTVLSGRVEATVDGVPYLLEEGDSLHFRAYREHGFVNVAEGPTVLLIAHRPRLSL